MAELAVVFRALSDPNRLAIYELIREREHSPVADLERSVSALAREFDLTLSTVSHHIKELRQAGLIRCVKRAQTVYCEADPTALEAIERFLAVTGDRDDKRDPGRTRPRHAAPPRPEPRGRKRTAGGRTTPQTKGKRNGHN
jgi:ArsR family transcriptional regulator, arsenate/arsenite/antimonite-responsive transcriptional repressor